MLLTIALSCDYQYDIQPAQTALSCSKLTAFVLKCQVLSNRSDFSITWHYSNSEPDISSIHTATNIRNSRSTFINTMWNFSHDDSNVSLTSELRMYVSDEKDTIDGYYWCSVNSSNDIDDTMPPNPSIVLHILHRIDCTTKAESTCEYSVNFYSPSSEMPSRCADRNISVDIVEAQNCTTGERIEPTTKQNTEFDIDPQITDDLDMQNVSSIPTPTVMTKTFITLPLTLGIIIGASTGGVILVLFIVIGLLLICMARMKGSKRQKVGNQVESTTPVDDIIMQSSAPANEIEDASSRRVSKMFLESNISYDCPQDIIGTQQTNENVYASIQ